MKGEMRAAQARTPEHMRIVGFKRFVLAPDKIGQFGTSSAQRYEG